MLRRPFIESCDIDEEVCCIFVYSGASTVNYGWKRNDLIIGIQNYGKESSPSISEEYSMPLGCEDRISDMLISFSDARGVNEKSWETETYLKGGPASKDRVHLLMKMTASRPMSCEASPGGPLVPE